MTKDGRRIGVRLQRPSTRGCVVCADVHVSGSAAERVKRRMDELKILEEDLTEKFVLGSGKGGQKVNKTNSCVYLRHDPSGIEVKCQRSRSRALNRHWARAELCERLAERVEGERSKRQQQMEKIRRQKRRKSRRQRARELSDKRHQGEKKKMRRAVRADD